MKRVITPVPSEKWIVPSLPEAEVNCLYCNKPIRYFEKDDPPEYHNYWTCRDKGKKVVLEKLLLRKQFNRKWNKLTKKKRKRNAKRRNN